MAVSFAAVAWLLPLSSLCFVFARDPIKQGRLRRGSVDSYLSDPSAPTRTRTRMDLDAFTLLQHDNRLLECYNNFLAADRSGDQQISRDEYLTFLSLQSGGRMTETTFHFLPWDLISIYITQACTTCYSATFDGNCCLGNQVYIDIQPRDAAAFLREIEQTCKKVNQELVTLFPPTSSPTRAPTSLPTSSPTDAPTTQPTASPTVSPAPSAPPTVSPTKKPTGAPTRRPKTRPPTREPTREPTPATREPTPATRPATAAPTPITSSDSDSVGTREQDVPQEQEDSTARSIEPVTANDGASFGQGILVGIVSVIGLAFLVGTWRLAVLLRSPTRECKLPIQVISSSTLCASNNSESSGGGPADGAGVHHYPAHLQLAYDSSSSVHSGIVSWVSAAEEGSAISDLRMDGVESKHRKKRIERITFIAPPGNLEVVLDDSDDGDTIVLAVKGSSVIGHLVHHGDKLVAVDGIDVTKMSATQVSCIISERVNNPERKLTVLREVDPTADVEYREVMQAARAEETGSVERSSTSGNTEYEDAVEDLPSHKVDGGNKANRRGSVDTSVAAIYAALNDDLMMDDLDVSTMLWEEVEDRDGRTFYQNSVSGEIAWQRPTRESLYDWSASGEMTWGDAPSHDSHNDNSSDSSERRID